MNHIYNLLIWTMAVCICITPSNSYAKSSLDKVATGIIAAESPEGLQNSCRYILNALPNAHLKLLIAHHNDSVALAAAWEQVLRSLSNNYQKQDNQRVPLDDITLARFLGFVEGRIQVPLPELWESGIQVASCDNFRKTVFPLTVEQIYEDKPDDEHAHQNPTPEVNRNNKQLEVSLGDEKWSLPVDDITGAADFAAITSTKDTVYIGLYDNVPDSYVIFAIDRLSKNVLWSIPVWADGDFVTNRTGLNWHKVQLKVQTNRLVVYGISSSAAYIESFKLDTGENICRFGTTYFEIEK